MKLKTTSKSKAKANKATDTSAKNGRASKKSKVPKIRKDFDSLQHYRAEMGTVDLTQLTYGVINGHEAKSVNTPDGVVTLKNSWVELILLLISTVYENYKDEFKIKIAESNIASETFIIDKTYGRYSFDKKKQYNVYKIFDTGLYLESVFAESDIFQALIGLVNLCGIKLDEFKINIVSKEYKERAINFELLSSDEKIVTIDTLSNYLKDNWVITEIEIMNEKLGIKDLGVIMWIFCKWVYDNFGEAGVLKLPKHKFAGVSKSNDRDDVSYQELSNAGVFVYTSKKDSDTIRFMRAAVEKLEIPIDTVKFKIRQLKTDLPQDPYLYEQYQILKKSKA